MENDGLVTSQGRSKTKVTEQGVSWMLKMLRWLKDYTSTAERAVSDISVSAAIAADDFSKGQAVFLKMEDGVLIATSDKAEGARGIATSDAKRGEDIGVAGIEGLIKFSKGHVQVLSVPDIVEGGSKKVNLNLIKVETGKTSQIGAIGIEALAAIRKTGLEARYFYGVREAATQAAQHGSEFLVVCTNSDVLGFLALLEEKGIKYTLTNTQSKE